MLVSLGRTGGQKPGFLQKYSIRAFNLDKKRGFFDVDASETGSVDRSFLPPFYTTLVIQARQGWRSMFHKSLLY
ncbi:hypothetical protein QUB63_03170 [Microcoleus sp. ARI1-B5]|uniref:hypothetical protein n=1 Tax=unclassified Microcoleus TaxID=2642155 RepID=UPI002FD2993E